MTSACEELMNMLERSNCFDVPERELQPLQLSAARELFKVRRTQIPLLDRRARDAGIEELRTTDDIIPLLFSHTSFKSYPASFVRNGQWDRMTKWLGTVSAVPTTNVDVTGVRDIDEWIERLWAAGHLVSTTSGTSGKVSVLNRTTGDDAWLRRVHAAIHGWPRPLKPDHSRHTFYFVPRRGPYLLMIAAASANSLFARPDSMHFLTDEPMRLTRLTEMAEMRARMADGSATPEEIAEFERAAALQAADVRQRLSRMIERIVELRHEPIIVTGGWVQLWTLMEQARAMGVKEGDFGPDARFFTGGGLKGAKLPADYAEQVDRYLGHRLHWSYGMSEMSFIFPRCEVGNYHQTPWTIPFILDQTGETPIGDRNGVVEGRFAYLDLTNEARWNGLISGDKVTMDFRGQCPCGRRGNIVVAATGVARYADLGEEDKIGCAGTIDAYIQGAIAE